MRPEIIPIKSRKIGVCESKAADSISLYSAVSRMNDHEHIRCTQGYEMLRQLSYTMQKELAKGNTVRLVDIFE